MIIPVRCFTCGNVLASKYQKYLEDIKNSDLKGEALVISSSSISDPKILNTPQKNALDKLNLTRYCCRRHMISHVDIINYL